MLILTGCSNEKRAIITGEIIGSNPSGIILFKPYQDFTQDEVIEIPVTDGHFKYEMQVEEPEAYYLIFKESVEFGSGAMMSFFVEEGKLSLTLFSEAEFAENFVTGGSLNKELHEFTEELEAQEFQSIEEQLVWRKSYIQRNTNFLSYFLILQDLTSGFEIQDLEFYKQAHRKLSAEFPNHSYNEIIRISLAGHAMDVGSKYVNFSAPDIEGQIVKLSDKIQGKVALINLWATWCAPCISKSREMVPIVEKYGKRGFVVVGVAGEFKSTDNLKKFLENNEFPWLNLVELDRENNLWAKYGISRSGGGMFLVDKNGKILLKNPTAAEVEEKLTLLFP